ncbi:MAG: ubiquitin-conjugating enzyme E2 [Candidatus Micrarchaeota archaeon]
MPKLPEGIWRRRLENEYNTLKTNSNISNLEANAEKSEYHFKLSANGHKKNGDSIVPIASHDVSIYLTREYPYAGGIEVIWDSPIFHPNIREKDGAVCIQLVNKWSEGQTLSNVVDALVQMLENPNPYSPLNSEAAKYFANYIPQKTKPNKPRVVV